MMRLAQGSELRVDVLILRHGLKSYDMLLDPKS